MLSICMQLSRDVPWLQKRINLAVFLCTQQMVTEMHAGSTAVQF